MKWHLHLAVVGVASALVPDIRASRYGRFAAPRPLVVTRASAEDVETAQLDAEERMGKSLESLQGNLATLRTGRAAPEILDRVVVDY